MSWGILEGFFGGLMLIRVSSKLLRQKPRPVCVTASVLRSLLHLSRSAEAHESRVYGKP